MLVPPTPDMLNIFNSWKACFAKMVGQMSFTLVQVGLCGWRGLQGLDVCSDTNPNTAHLHVQRSCAVHLEKSHNMQWNQRVQGPCILYHLVSSCIILFSATGGKSLTQNKTPTLPTISWSTTSLTWEKNWCDATRLKPFVWPVRSDILLKLSESENAAASKRADFPRPAMGDWAFWLPGMVSSFASSTRFKHGTDTPWRGKGQGCKPQQDVEHSDAGRSTLLEECCKAVQSSQPKESRRYNKQMIHALSTKGEQELVLKVSVGKMKSWNL